MNCTWIEPGALLAMSMPWPEDLDELADAGVGGVVSLTERLPEGLPHDALRHVHLPVRDFRPPTLDQLASAVEFIEDVLRIEKAVAVHCGAGLGRTGTICAAWLVSRGRSAIDAIAEVRRLRPGSVETREQMEVVMLYARGIGTGGLESGGEQTGSGS